MRDASRYTTPPDAAKLEQSTERLKASLDRLEAGSTTGLLLASTLVYVAGRFSASDRAGVELNIQAAALVGIEVARLGACPMIPHCNTAHPDFENVQPYKFWIAATLEQLRRCDALITVPGWELSSGARGEVNAAHDMLKPVFHGIPDLAKWLARRKREILEA